MVTRESQQRWVQLGWIAVIALLVGCAPQAEHPPVVFINDVVWHAGDEAAWAQPGFDDSGWEKARLGTLRGQESIFWFRARLELAASHALGAEPMAVEFSAMATCDLFWDGQPLTLPGAPGTDRATEEPGLIDVSAYLPTPWVTAGQHLIAARCSTHLRQIEPTQGFYFLGVGPQLLMDAFTRGYSWKAMASLTAKLVAGVYFLAVFAAGRRSKPALWLGLFCLTAATLLIAEAWRSLVGYTYDWHIPRLWVVHALAWGCNLWLVLYFLTRFPGRWRRPVAIGAFFTSLAIPFLSASFDTRVAATFLLGLGVSLVWGLNAIRLKARSSGLATLGVGLCLVVFAIDPARFLDQRVFLALDVMIALLLMTQAMEARRERDDLEATRLRATRLELELVKKSIQPHFLMNTLTALSEWFEREPAVAAAAIDALSREIRLLGDLADRRTVPLASELELCRAHLDVMSLRRGGRYRLVTSVVDERAPCPPGIIHTMVENAVTHGPTPHGQEVLLELESSLVDGRCRYRLSGPMAVTGGQTSSHEGTGMRYIRTRLAEAFGEDYTLTAGRRDGRWVNEWTVPKTKASA